MSTTPEQYCQLLPRFGIIPLLMLLEEFEAGDQYEDCAAILEGIRLHNARSNESLPTTLVDAFSMEADKVMQEATHTFLLEVRGPDYYKPHLNMLKLEIAGQI